MTLCRHLEVYNLHHFQLWLKYVMIKQWSTWINQNPFNFNPYKLGIRNTLITIFVMEFSHEQRDGVIAVNLECASRARQGLHKHLHDGWMMLNRTPRFSRTPMYWSVDNYCTVLHFEYRSICRMWSLIEGVDQCGGGGSVKLGGR